MRNGLLPLVGALLLAGVTRGQTAPVAPTATFDVASVKSNKSDVPKSIRAGLHGTFGATNAPMQDLLTWAFGMKGFQLVGAPPWLRSERFDIEAKVDEKENTTLPELQSRLQALLADRFKLTTHWDTRQLPVFALVQAKNGTKLLPSKPSECVSPDIKAALPPPSPNRPAPCGIPLLRKNRLDGIMLNLEFVRAILEDRLSRTVLDETGLKGTYTVHLAWSADDPTVAENQGVAAISPPGDQGPSLFTALDEQLGLHLQSRTAPVKVLVIDHIEQQPAEN